MPTVTTIGRVLVPVSDQDAAIAWYAEHLGFTVASDIWFGEDAGSRWVEVSPPGGGASLALMPTHVDFAAPHVTGVSLCSGDPAALRERLLAEGVDVDDLWGGDGTVPLGFMFRDGDGNQLIAVEVMR